ncbi:39S ribosomal protein L42, mitochondrial [Myotis brandtii]|uniref:Large ribosomal subunit protein mL42 n=1 Tax=Myotis brandtii TaxID=109478 RepID=S7PU80_MYOBR|nr:39S ribosomal protein L42, mitochondrial [Myotis brandtii]
MDLRGQASRRNRVRIPCCPCGGGEETATGANKVELALTSDGRTIVCYHPSVDIPYEHTKPIPRPDPVHNYEETQDQILKTRLEVKDEHLEQGPMIEQLSKMFFTTKHRWYPYGQ